MMGAELRSLAACLLLAFATSAQAQSATVERIDITDYGIYTMWPAGTWIDPQGVKHHKAGDIRLVATTRTVPLQRDVQFGFRYVVAGTPTGARVPVRQIVIYPEPGVLKPGTSQPMLRNENRVFETIGNPDYFFYALTQPWELVAGDWTIEIWSGDQKLVSQTFTVVK